MWGCDAHESNTIFFAPSQEFPLNCYHLLCTSEQYLKSNVRTSNDALHQCSICMMYTINNIMVSISVSRMTVYSFPWVHHKKYLLGMSKICHQHWDDRCKCCQFSKDYLILGVLSVSVIGQSICAEAVNFFKNFLQIPSNILCVINAISTNIFVGCLWKLCMST